MSEDIRKMIDRIKNHRQSINENINGSSMSRLDEITPNNRITTGYQYKRTEYDDGSGGLYYHYVCVEYPKFTIEFNIEDREWQVHNDKLSSKGFIPHAKTLRDAKILCDSIINQGLYN